MEMKLIEAVRNRRAIYQLSHPMYKNHRVRDVLWMEIANIVGEPVQRCRQRWKSLRERARREYNKPEQSTWPFLKELRFLNDTFRIKNNVAGIKKEEEDYAEEEDEEEEEVEDVTENCEIVLNEFDNIQEEISPFLFCASKRTNSPEPSTSSSFNSRNRINPEVTDEGAMMLFFKSLCKRMGNKFTDEEELELQQAFIGVFLQKTKEFEIRKNKRE